MTYVYLNTYPQGYLYVGSHTWDGPEGVLDPDYHGTSHIAKMYLWEPIKEEILEIVAESRKYLAEKEWIEKYAAQYGIADCAVGKAKSDWWKRFGRHGKMLNLHSNYASQIISDEVRRKSVATKKVNGLYTIKLQSPEVKDKMIATRKANGALLRWVKASHTKEAQLKRVESRKRTSRHVRYLDFEGTVTEVAEFTGLDKANIQRHIRCGEHRFCIKGKEFVVC